MGGHAGSRCHGNHPSAVIQAFLRSAAHQIADTTGQAAKAEHLGKTAGGIPRHSGQTAFRIMADQFRHKQDPARQFLSDILCNLIQDLVPVGSPIPAQKQCQHSYRRLSFASIIAHAVRQI